MKNFRFASYIFLLCNMGTSLSADDCFPDYCEYSFENGQFNWSAEWLFWHVKQDNMRSGSFIDDFPDPELKVANASVIQPKDKFCNGFRVNLGYEYPCNQWEFNAIFTYMPLQSRSDFREVIPVDMQTESHRQFIIPNIDGFPSFQAFSQPGGLIGFTSLLTKWGGNLFYVDIDLARKVSLSHCFSLKPHIGFRGAWMKQHLHMEGGLLAPSVNESTFGRLKYKEKFDGYGMEGGVWANWHLGCGFSLVGHIGGSILYSHFRVDVVSESSLGEEGAVVFIINSPSKATIAIPTMDYLAGLEYEANFSDFLILLHVGWEQRIFLNMNQLSVDGQNLSLQGLSLGGEVRF